MRGNCWQVRITKILFVRWEFDEVQPSFVNYSKAAIIVNKKDSQQLYFNMFFHLLCCEGLLLTSEFIAESYNRNSKLEKNHKIAKSFSLLQTFKSNPSDLNLYYC